MSEWLLWCHRIILASPGLQYGGFDDTYDIKD